MDVKIAISSSINYHELTIPILVNSLISAGIEKSEIHVFIAGFSKYSHSIKDEINYHELDHNSFECSPLIEIVDKEIESDYWFLIHDTCKVGKKFKDLLYRPLINRPTKVALRPCPSMSIGIYEYKYLLSVKDQILTVKNTDYSEESLSRWKSWHVNNEDFVLWKNFPPAELYGGYEFQVIDQNNWYKNNIIRRTEYYEALDLYKNKANWGQSSIFTIDI